LAARQGHSFFVLWTWAQWGNAATSKEAPAEVKDLSLVEIPATGGHHFGGHYNEIARRILDEALPR